MIPLATSRRVRRVKQASFQPELWNRCPGPQVPSQSQPGAPRGFSALRAPQCPPRCPSLAAPLPGTFPQPQCASVKHQLVLLHCLACVSKGWARRDLNEHCSGFWKPDLGHPGFRWRHPQKAALVTLKWSHFVSASASLPPCQVLCKPWESSLSTLCHGVILL